jgi:hypothetical protein
MVGCPRVVGSCSLSAQPAGDGLGSYFAGASLVVAAIVGAFRFGV